MNTNKEYKSGEVLENGATVIDGKPGVVLAMLPWKREFVTWATNEKGDTFWGHYFKNIEEAAKDYNGRG